VEELSALASMSDAEIDVQEMPEVLDWHNAQIGKYYRPLKKPVSLRVDLDVLVWLQCLGKGYQTKMNDALREYMDRVRRDALSELSLVREARSSGGADARAPGTPRSKADVVRNTKRPKR
jgi:uncharacterized protein (DUF4415 family)